MTGGLLAGLFADSAFSAYLLAFVVELVLTFLFVLAILGVTADNRFSQVGGLVIGAALTGVHLVGIRITGTSVNPARSLSAALFALIGNDTEAIKEIWIYICAPLLGALLTALLWKALFVKKSANETK